MASSEHTRSVYRFPPVNNTIYFFSLLTNDKCNLYLSTFVLVLSGFHNNAIIMANEKIVFSIISGY